jgi:hypothetical protein
MSIENTAMSKHANAKTALNEFLPEAAFTADVSEPGSKPHLHIPPDELVLDPIDAGATSAVQPNSARVEMWPMLAAALVAIGVSMLAMAAVAKFGFPAS